MYWIIRILMVVLMLTPTGYFMAGKIELGDYFLLIGMALILVELADISEAVKSKRG
jgi:hypothetical protein